MFKEKGIMREFNDGTKRINIDYKSIREYDEPFVMTLKVNGKRKLDVWEVENGEEADRIREQYKKINRKTSYADFYKTIEDLIEEKNEDDLQFNPRIRGKNKRNLDTEENKSTIDLGRELYDFLLDSFHTRENVEAYARQTIKERLEEAINNILDKIKNS